MFCKTKTKPKVSEKKGATGQSFIRKEITCYRIGTLVLSSFQATWASLCEMELELKSLDWNGNELKYGFRKKLLRYKGTFDQLNPFALTDLEKKWGQKGSTGQRFICSELTSYKIHILEHELELEDMKPTKMTTIFSQQFLGK